MAAPRYPHSLDQHAVCLRDAAQRKGIATSEVQQALPDGRAPRRWLTFAIGPTTFYYRSGRLHRTTPESPGATVHINRAGREATVSKDRTRQVLAAAGVSAPRGRLFARHQAADAAGYADALGGAVCVKPNRGSKGINVFPERRGRGVVTAFETVAARHAEIVVEESLPYELIRYFYVHPRAVAVKISRPANVVGDGRSTVAALIAEKNMERRRRHVPGHYPVVIDYEMLAILGSRGLDLASVPAEGERIMLRLTSNGAVGADSIECIDDIHPSYGEQVEAACRALSGVLIAAIDMAVIDRTQPAAPGNHWIIEVNSSPGVLPYHYPWEGRAQDVSGAIIDLLLRDADAA